MLLQKRSLLPNTLATTSTTLFFLFPLTRSGFAILRGQLLLKRQHRCKQSFLLTSLFLVNVDKCSFLMTAIFMQFRGWDFSGTWLPGGCQVVHARGGVYGNRFERGGF